MTCSLTIAVCNQAVIADALHICRNYRLDVRHKQYTFDAVKNWFGTAGHNGGLPWYCHSHVFVPVNLTQYHWFALVIDLQHAVVTCYDPMPVSYAQPPSNACCVQLQHSILLCYHVVHEDAACNRIKIALLGWNAEHSGSKTKPEQIFLVVVHSPMQISS